MDEEYAYLNNLIRINFVASVLLNNLIKMQ